MDPDSCLLLWDAVAYRCFEWTWCLLLRGLSSLITTHPPDTMQKTWILWLSIYLLITLTSELSQRSEWRPGTTWVLLDWLNIKMETLRFSETSISVYLSTRRNITRWRQSWTFSPTPHSALTVKRGTGVGYLTTQETATVWDSQSIMQTPSAYRCVSIYTSSWTADCTSHVYQLTWKPLTGWKPTPFKAQTATCCPSLRDPLLANKASVGFSRKKITGILYAKLLLKPEFSVT